MNKIIKDITQEVIKYNEQYKFLPNEVKITKAQILLNDWNEYYLDLYYVMDGVEHNITERYLYSLEGVLITVLEHIKDYYTKLHMLQM